MKNLQRNPKVLEKIVKEIDIDETWVEQYINSSQIYLSCINEFKYEKLDLDEEDLNYQLVVICSIISKIFGKYFFISIYK